MSFNQPSAPPPLVMPTPPPPVAPLSPVGMRPQRKPMQSTFLGDITASQQQAPQRSLIGGAPTTFGA